MWPFAPEVRSEPPKGSPHSMEHGQHTTNPIAAVFHGTSVPNLPIANASKIMVRTYSAEKTRRVGSRVTSFSVDLPELRDCEYSVALLQHSLSFEASSHCAVDLDWFETPQVDTNWKCGDADRLRRKSPYRRSQRAWDFGSMRLTVQEMLLMAPLALLGCSSPSVPMWAVTAAQSQHHLGEVRPIARSGLKSVPVARSSVADVATVGRNQDYDNTMNDAASIASVSGIEDDRGAFRELDQKLEEERRKMNAAMTICRTC